MLELRRDALALLRPPPPVDLAEWLNEKVDAIRILGRALELTVDCHALPPDIEVELDLKSMPYALTNLLRNALKYAKTRVVVSAEIWVVVRAATWADDRALSCSSFSAAIAALDRADNGVMGKAEI